MIFYLQFLANHSIIGKNIEKVDDRGTLFFDIARILKHKNQKHSFFRNVKQLFGHDGGNTLKPL
jgi:DNA (cytosine-5)-methyltransferase 1